MNKYDIVIIGAGAAGMAAARELSIYGKKILVLEARDRIGGRIHSISDSAFPQVIEAGAEFIHGRLPETLRLLDIAKIKKIRVRGSMYKVRKGIVQKTDQFIEGGEQLLDKMKEVQDDMPIADFLHQFFPGEMHSELRETVTGYVEGYDAGDIKRASTIGLREEWEQEGEEQERISRGYGELLNSLFIESKRSGCELLLSSQVHHVIWRANHVEVKTECESFYGYKVLVTIPLSLWQVSKDTKGYISYTPTLAVKEEAARMIGYGSVIKIILLFNSKFWEHDIPNKMTNASFIFSDAEIPTWWTQHPRTFPMLTGWLGGPKANDIQYKNESVLLQKAIHSLAYIFGVTTAYITERLHAHKVFNWAQEPYSLGAYSYATIATQHSKKVMSESIENTLFFAGEALYEGSETGTVEAALANGLKIAREILSSDPFVKL